jgi:acyl-coenzyme A synthetase/AMP-(fatty) acid ligase
LEEAILELPGIREVAVVGVTDELLGEAAKAFVVGEPDPGRSTESLLMQLSQRLPRYKLPKHVEWCEALPRNASGKILKPQLRALAHG